jgi:hypothetical protein
MMKTDVVFKILCFEDLTAMGNVENKSSPLAELFRQRAIDFMIRKPCG